METHASLGRCEDAKHREVVQKKIAIYLLHIKKVVRLKSEVSKRCIVSVSSPEGFQAGRFSEDLLIKKKGT
jgi:hypothetical protein